MWLIGNENGYTAGRVAVIDCAISVLDDVTSEGGLESSRGGGGEAGVADKPRTEELMVSRKEVGLCAFSKHGLEPLSLAMPPLGESTTTDVQWENYISRLRTGGRG
jgi:hypothetical protein